LGRGGAGPRDHARGRRACRLPERGRAAAGAAGRGDAADPPDRLPPARRPRRAGPARARRRPRTGRRRGDHPTAGPARPRVGDRPLDPADARADRGPPRAARARPRRDGRAGARPVQARRAQAQGPGSHAQLSRRLPGLAARRGVPGPPGRHPGPLVTAVEVAPGVLVTTSAIDTTTSTVVVDGAHPLPVDPAWRPRAPAPPAARPDDRRLPAPPRAPPPPPPPHPLWDPRFGAAARWASPRTAALAASERATLLDQMGPGWPPELLALLGAVEAVDGDRLPAPWEAVEIVVHDGHAPGHTAVR